MCGCWLWWVFCLLLFFFFNDTATTEIYTLSLHDALPIEGWSEAGQLWETPRAGQRYTALDRKSTRLNSSHLGISYAVFCLKKKNTIFSPFTCHEKQSDSKAYTSSRPSP